MTVWRVEGGRVVRVVTSLPEKKEGRRQEEGVDVTATMTVDHVGVAPRGVVEEEVGTTVSINLVMYIIMIILYTSKSPSSGRDPWGKDRRNCNAERGRTKWRPILRHGDAADSGSSLDGHRQLS